MKNNHLDQDQKRFHQFQSSQDTFIVPRGYFDDQAVRIMDASKVSPVSNHSLKKMAIAASIILAIGVSAALFYLQPMTSASEALTSSDFATYLLHENMEIDQLAFHVSDQQLEFDLLHVSDESIEDYILEQNIDINHLTIEQ
jgi:hypothetical protein